jgi:purine-binding chemotaxis protein CheW
MDIAKIRKKLKDADVKQSADDLKTPEAEEKPSNGLPSAPGPLQVMPPEPDTEAGGPGAPETGSSADEGHDSEGREQKKDAGSVTPAESGYLETQEERGSAAAEPPAAESKLGGQIKQKTAPDAEAKLQYKEKPGTEGSDGSGKGDDVIEILTFSLLREEFAFRISQLKEILKYQRITEVPKMPEYVLGITSLRGKVIPVIDLRTKILPREKSPGISEKTKILIIKGPKGMIGAVVDRVSGVMRIVKSEILPPPTHLSEEQLRFIEGVAVLDKRFVSIVNMEEAITIHLQ